MLFQHSYVRNLTKKNLRKVRQELMILNNLKFSLKEDSLALQFSNTKNVPFSNTKNVPFSNMKNKCFKYENVSFSNTKNVICMYFQIQMLFLHQTARHS